MGRPVHRGLLVACLLCAGALAAQPVEYEFRAAPENRLALTVEKTGLWRGRTHVFVFGKYTAKAVINLAAPSESSVELSIDAASATCGDVWLSEKDRDKVLAYMRREMLDVEHHPVLVFRSERVEVIGNGSYRVAGRLTVRGIEKPVAVTALLEERGGGFAISGEATVKIKDYGLTPPKAALGAIGTKNEMTVRFRLVPEGSSRQAAAPGPTRSGTSYIFQ